MKNMKVSKKLIVSFSLVVALTIAVGLVGIFGIITINDNSLDVYHNRMTPVPYVLDAEVMMKQQMIDAYRMYMYAARQDIAGVSGALAAAESFTQNIESNVLFYRDGVRDPVSIALIDEALELHADVFMPAIREVHNVLNSDSPDLQAATEALYLALEASRTMRANYQEVIGIRLFNTGIMVENAEREAQRQIIITIVLFVAVIAIAVLLVWYISRLLSKPLTSLSSWMKYAASTGDISLSEEDMNDIEQMGVVKDEIGETLKYCGEFVMQVKHMVKELSLVANGDLTRDVQVLSPDDAMGNSLQNLLSNLNNMFGEINTATHQVSTGSKQIVDGAQTLAQGSTEQAASVQQLSSSIAEIAEKTKGNAEMAGKAAMLANDIKGSAEKGNRQMDEMMAAVKDINESGQNISKVIKSIDDIAFQTNILALNAAVEAARAGQHGKGFAVVAEEVRNLAAKSAAAAKDTESLIADSIEKAELGSKIADDTAASLAEIVAGIGESSQLVSEIATSSEEQSASIRQINTGVDQVAQVVQQNSATAQQSAAASEEMSGQSDMLEELISRFKLKSSNGSGRISASAAKSLPAPAQAEAGESFGKY